MINIDTNVCPICHTQVGELNSYGKYDPILDKVYPTTKTIEKPDLETVGILFWNCETCRYYWKNGQFK